MYTAAAVLQPRLDDGIIAQKAHPSLGTTRRRKTCKFTHLVSGAAAASTGSIAGTATSSSFGTPVYNASTLANQLPYARSSTAIYIPSQQSGSPAAGSSAPDSNPSGDSGSSEAEGRSSVSLAAQATGSGVANLGENGASGLVAIGSGTSVSASSAGSAGGCAQQVTVTVTSQTTVTVTQGAQDAGLAESNTAPGSGGEAVASSGPNSGEAASAPAEGAQAATTGSSPSKNGDQGAQAATTAGINVALLSLATAGATGKKRTKCSKSTGTIFAIASAGIFPPIGGGSNSSLMPSDLIPSGTAPLPSGTGLAARHFESSVPIVSSNITTNDTSNAVLKGELWAGVTLGTVVRMEAIPERVFYDYDGTTVKDPFETLGNAGVNAVRVEGQRGQCVGPSKFVNNGSTLGEELLFALDWGCLDTQVQAAQRGLAQGMRVVMTINQGFDIPPEMESYSYEQMVGAVQAEAKRQLQPFLDAKIVPDVILFENEGSDGFLFNETATGHTRGLDDGKVSKATLDKEKCGIIPTGNMDSFPQYAGYLKAEVMACNEAISTAGFSLDAVRYGLHSHGQYVQWKESVVHGPNPGNQTYLADSSGKECTNPAIPQNLLSQNVSEMLTILGFSAYPDPMTPVDINSAASQKATLNRLTATLTQLQGYAESYGKHTDGPFAGQYKLQSLGVEYATSFTHDQIPQEQALTAMMWETVKTFSNVLGMLWYEPWYCHGDWEGGRAALCHDVGTGDISGEAPTNTLKTWGVAAVSPWKK